MALPAGHTPTLPFTPWRMIAAGALLGLPSGGHGALVRDEKPERGVALQLTSAQLLRLGEAAAARGELKTARQVYRALSSDPLADVRNEARFRLASMEITDGDLRAAASLLRQIIDERPDASRARFELAQLLQKLGDIEGAWRQVRAIQAGVLPPAVARLIDRYSTALRAERVSGGSFGIALAPDSNINHATRSDTVGTVLGDFDISKTAKAKSGVGLALNGQAFRRFALSGDSSLLLRISGFANLYRRSDFNHVAADIAIGPEVKLGRNRLQLELGAMQQWFGQKSFMRSARFAGILSHPMGTRALLRLSGSAAWVDNEINDLQDGKAYSGQVAIERALTPTTGVAVRFGMDRQSLADPGYAITGWRAGSSAWHDIGQVTVTADAELGRLRADDRLLLFSDRRRDKFWRITVGATFRQLQFRGFAPLIRVSAEQNRSSIAFYDYRRFRTEIGFDRAF